MHSARAPRVSFPPLPRESQPAALVLPAALREGDVVELRGCLLGLRTPRVRCGVTSVTLRPRVKLVSVLRLEGPHLLVGMMKLGRAQYVLRLKKRDPKSEAIADLARSLANVHTDEEKQAVVRMLPEGGEWREIWSLDGSVVADGGDEDFVVRCDLPVGQSSNATEFLRRLAWWRGGGS